MTTETQQVTVNKKIVIDFMYVDLDVCTRRYRQDSQERSNYRVADQ